MVAELAARVPQRWADHQLIATTPEGRADGHRSAHGAGRASPGGAEDATGQGAGGFSVSQGERKTR